MNNNSRIFKTNRFLLIFFITMLGFLTPFTASATNRNPVADFDGDGRTDISVFRPSDGYWYISKSSGGYLFVPWGLASDTLVPGDYDGDGKTDLAVYRYGSAPRDETAPNIWYILKSSDNTFLAKVWGTNGTGRQYILDIAAPADYDGDGRTDLAFQHYTDGIGPSSLAIVRSSNNFSEDKYGGHDLNKKAPPADYDGDGKVDLTDYNNGNWSIIESSSGIIRTESFGITNDKLVPADYDGDGKADIAVWRPSNGYWYWISSRDKSFHSIQFGLSDDKPVPGDYDGDRITDVAVFRPSNGVWYLQQSTKGFRAEQFGLSMDIPIPNVFVR